MQSIIHTYIHIGILTHNNPTSTEKWTVTYTERWANCIHLPFQVKAAQVFWLWQASTRVTKTMSEQLLNSWLCIFIRLRMSPLLPCTYICIYKPDSRGTLCIMLQILVYDDNDRYIDWPVHKCWRYRGIILYLTAVWHTCDCRQACWSVSLDAISQHQGEWTDDIYSLNDIRTCSWTQSKVNRTM